MGTQQFCLKWNNHQSNMLTVFEQLLSTEALVDVTLACDGLSLKAHKMVLSACSPYFQSLFLENPCKHPIVIMKDMRYTELKAIIDFMYRGEVNVSHDQLNALLRTAETLKVKGLAEVSGENRTAAGMVQQEIVQQNVTTPPATGPPPQTRSDSPTLLSKRKRGRPRKRSLSDSNRSDDEQVPSKIKEPGSPEIEELSGDASIEANDISLSSNSQTQVHQSLTSSSVHNSHLNKHPSSIQSSHDSQVEEPPSDDGDFEVEPSKLMEQTLTTDVPVMSNSTPQSTVAPSVHIVPLSSSSGLDVNTRSIVPSGSESTTLVPASASIASDSLSSSQMQGPDSPQDASDTGNEKCFLPELLSSHQLNTKGNEPNVHRYLTETELYMIFRRSQNHRQFAVNVARTLFSPQEMRESNCRGVRDKNALDEAKLDFIQGAVCRFFGFSPSVTWKIWKSCMQSIDAHCRHERRLHKKIKCCHN